MPFVQGHLRDEPISIRFESQCACCARPLHLDIDSELSCRVHEEDAHPLVFVPLVDFEKWKDPSIIDGF